MSVDATGMQVSIMGREFRVACAPDEQKSLQQAVEYLNRKMQEIKEQGKITSIKNQKHNRSTKSKFACDSCATEKNGVSCVNDG